MIYADDNNRKMNSYFKPFRGEINMQYMLYIYICIKYKTTTKIDKINCLIIKINGIIINAQKAYIAKSIISTGSSLYTLCRAH